MKGLLLGLGLMVAIAVVAGIGFEFLDTSATSTYTSPNNSVRVN